MEYLNQLNLKADMVMDELKRVSAQRDTLKHKLEESDKAAAEASAELEQLRKESVTIGASNGTDVNKVEENGSSGAVGEPKEEPIETVLDATAPAFEPAAQNELPLPPKSQSQSGVDTVGQSEDLFSYDSELPRLQSELQQRESKIVELQTENISLKTDLAVTKESAEHLMQNLETATNDLREIKDSRERLQLETAEQHEALQANVDDLRAKLEAAVKGLEKSQGGHGQHEETVANLKEALERANQELEQMKSKPDVPQDAGEMERLHGQVERLEKDLAEVRSSQTRHEKRNETLNGLVQTLKDQLKQAETERDHVMSDFESLRGELHRLEQSRSSTSLNGPDKGQDEKLSVQEGGTATGDTDATASSKKKNKKKKKTTKGSLEPAQNPSASPATEEPIPTSTPPADSSTDLERNLATYREEAEGRLAELQQQLGEKDAAISRLHSRLKDQDELKEEIEGLKDDLLHVGGEHVEAKEMIKELQAEKAALAEKVLGLEREIAELRDRHESNATAEQQRQTLAASFEDLKAKADALQTDLTAAEQLAASRFKDLTNLREALQKAQPELASLRGEVAELRTSREELVGKISDVHKLEAREKDLRSEISLYKSQLSEKDINIKALNDKISQELIQRLALEETNRKGQRDTQRLESERQDAVEASQSLKKDLANTQEELKSSRASLQNLEQQVARLTQEASRLRDEIGLKTAQHASAQSLMNSMQDQTQEMAAQMKEVRERCESLEEELADAHRLLSERSREGETMRRLLADVEGRAEARVKEMRERMDLAIEERDRAEDQANSVGRRRAREIEELKHKIHDAERDLNRASEEKNEFAAMEKELRRQKEETERRSALMAEEAAEVRQAMSQLRDALDEGEKQTRELEKEKADLRRALEETQQRLEKLQKSSKAMADELRSLQTAKNRTLESSAQSSRSSLDSLPSRDRVGSPLGKGRAPSVATSETTIGANSIDYVYLKNVLLQFLEQKDKKHQQQLVPVLGMLLHFDRSAIASRAATSAVHLLT